MRIFFIFFLFISCFLHGASLETMKNLELKVQLNQQIMTDLKAQLQSCYAETLIQTDTYFVSEQSRFKLREESGKQAYLIRYQRPNLQEAKESNYLFYPVSDVKLFLAVFGDTLQEELKVKKQRALYFPKPHIRVHLDQVEELGDFLEIEIILSKDISIAVAQEEMQELQQWLHIENLKKINCGYRELLQEKRLHVSQ
jgi:predicted adenylyl cyclase CyaB